MALPYTRGPIIVADDSPIVGLSAEENLIEDIRAWVDDGNSFASGTVALGIWNTYTPNRGSFGIPGGANQTSPNVTQTVVFQSDGEDGLRNICGALTVNQINARAIRSLVGADINLQGYTQGGISSDIGVHTNNDNGMTAIPAAPDSAPVLTGTGRDVTAGCWEQRRDGTSMQYIAVATKDFIKVFVDYTSESLNERTQGVIFFGFPYSSHRMMYQRARSRIRYVEDNTDANNAGRPMINTGAQYRQLILEHDITDALKDKLRATPTISPNADPYPQLLLYQAVSTSEAGGAVDYGMTELIPILTGSLRTLTVDGFLRTVYEIDVSMGFKLAYTGGRYDDKRGASTNAGNSVGDIVSVLSQPNMTACYSRTNEADFNPTAGNNLPGIVLAWTNSGQQIGEYVDISDNQPNTIRAFWMDEGSNDTTEGISGSAYNDNNPALQTNRHVPYYLSVLPDYSSGATLPARMTNITDNEDNIVVGYVPGCFWMAEEPSQNLSFGTLDNKPLTRRYRKFAYTPGEGWRKPTTGFGLVSTVAKYEGWLGPGW